MKKIILLVFVLSLAFVSCTDNTTEHEELSNKIQNIDKGGDTHIGGDGGDDDNNDI
ncbi:hypothetical protein [Tenacibaculum sp. 190524A02b]|uniref:hypothetical protein n=1 Tax=Tenacibaculum vairaonense TaxID=3137860 RepID=UPI0031FA9CBA